MIRLIFISKEFSRLITNGHTLFPVDYGRVFLNALRRVSLNLFSAH